MKNLAFIITLISFLGIITLGVMLFTTNINLLASVSYLFLLFSSFTLGICNLMIGTFKKSAKPFAIISILTFAFTCLTLFNPELYSALWNTAVLLHIGLITWTFVQVSPSGNLLLQMISRLSIIITAIFFIFIITEIIQSPMIFTLLKVGLFLSSGILIIQFIIQSNNVKE